MNKLKKCLMLVLLSIAFLPSIAQVKIQGKIENLPAGSKISARYYSNILDYRTSSLGECFVDSNGNFYLEFTVTENQFINLSFAAKMEIQSQTDYDKAFQVTYLLVHPNDSLLINLDYHLFDESIHFEGRGANRQNCIAKTLLFMESQKAPNYVKYSVEQASEYAQIFDSLEYNLQQFVAKVDTLNDPDFSKFLEMFTLYHYTDKRFMLAYNQSPDNGPFWNLLPRSYFNFLDSINLEQEKYLEVGFYLTACMRVFELPFSLFYKWDTTLSKSAMTEKQTLEHYNHLKATLQNPLKDIEMGRLLKSRFQRPRGERPAFFDSLYVDFTSNCTNETYNQSVKVAYDKTKNIAKGHPAPNFTFTTDKGDSLKLSDLKGKMVFIDFWSLTCGPCIEAMPKVHELVSEFKDNTNVAFLILDMASNPEQWKKFLAKHPYEDQSIQAHVDYKTREYISEQYNFKAIPRFIILDKKGNFLEPHHIFEKNESKAFIEAYLKRN
jgi:thiol-disulfide isomerase/thioredoxin